MNNLKLTILMPVYNQEQYIQQSLQSIFNQKTNFSYQIIIIDDASTDNSLKKIEKFSKKYSNKIRIIKNKKKLRLLRTIIKGYKLINTEYFCVLDPDDYWIDKNLIQKSILFLERHKTFSIYTNNFYIETKDKRTVAIENRNTNFSFNSYKKPIFGHTSSTIFRNLIFSKGIPKRLIKSINTKYEKVYRGDSFRNFIHLSKGKCHFENDIVSSYRVTGKGIWTSLNEFQQNYRSILFFSEMYYFFNKKNIFYLESSWTYIKKNIDLILSSSIRDITKTDLNLFFNISKKCILENKFKNIEKLNKEFIFYYPSKKVGGYQFFFIRLAEYLSNKLNMRVYYIDYKNGFVRKQFKKTNIKYINYPIKTKKNKINGNVIVPITMAHKIPNIFTKSSKVLFIDAHPESIKWLSMESKCNYSTLKSNLEKINKNKAICFMDWSSFKNATETLESKLNEKYLPVFAKNKKNNPNLRIIKKDEINIGWLGRLDPDKIYSLQNLLDNYLKIKTNKKKIIHIIGDGCSKDLLNIKKYSKKIKIIFTSTLINEKLDNYLVSKIDILFGMGISTLESAALKIPTVLVPSSLEIIKGNSFTFLYNSNKFTLGIDPKKTKEIYSQNYTLQQIINQVYKNKNQKKIIGTKCYEYSKQHHRQIISVLALIKNCTDSNLTFKKYIHIKNNLNHKNNFRIITRLKLTLYAFFLILNQIPIINKPFWCRDKIINKIIEVSNFDQ